MPSSPFAPPDFLTRHPFAHRGLHGRGVIENSRAAWDRAVAGGYGIECDVQLSADGVAHVFHDDRLERLTGEAGPVVARTSAELGAIRLSGTDETVPTLAELLARISVPPPPPFALSEVEGLSTPGTDNEGASTTLGMNGSGRTPLLIEIKSKGHLTRLCRAVANDLVAYTGEAAIMSFDPRACRWFRRHAPARVRGFVVTAQDQPGWWGDLKRRLAFWWADPHFIACDIRDLPSLLSRLARRRGLPVLTWTVRTPDQHATAAAHADQPIFEEQA
jgi:glycerophosphoryl diester phosphodiesterase